MAGHRRDVKFRLHTLRHNEFDRSELGSGGEVGILHLEKLLGCFWRCCNNVSLLSQLD
ncbi:hypothetical protein M758_5G060000 [Ceratodon purpureus]|nr:hypothetical protein M758_5G060000 [Ceratodon purpureus]